MSIERGWPCKPAAVERALQYRRLRLHGPLPRLLTVWRLFVRPFVQHDA